MAKLIKQGKQISNDGDHVMLNLHREREGHILSFKLLRENMKPGPFTL